MGLLYDLLQEYVVEQGRSGYSSFSIDWHVAGAQDEEDWLRAQKDWEEGYVRTVVDLPLQINISHFSGCVAHLGESLPQLKSEMAEEIRLSFECVEI
jgi:hypothetical protein